MSKINTKHLIFISIDSRGVPHCLWLDNHKLKHSLFHAMQWIHKTLDIDSNDVVISHNSIIFDTNDQPLFVIKKGNSLKFLHSNVAIHTFQHQQCSWSINRLNNNYLVFVLDGNIFYVYFFDGASVLLSNSFNTSFSISRLKSKIVDNEVYVAWIAHKKTDILEYNVWLINDNEWKHDKAKVISKAHTETLSYDIANIVYNGVKKIPVIE